MSASRLPIALLLLAMTLVGCGGDDSASPPESAATGPADAAYARRADAICATALAETRRIGQRFSHAQLTPATPDLSAVINEKLVAPGIEVRERLARRLRGLPPPRRGAESVQAYLELFDPLEVLSRQRLEAGRERDLDEVQRLEALMRELAEEQMAAGRLAGLPVCARDFVGTAFGRDDAG